MPQFDPASSHIARAPITVKPAGLIGTAELYLVSNAMKVASSGEVSFTSTGAAQSVSFPITMPAAEGTYKVYIDVFSDDELIGVFVAREDVVISPPVRAWECPVCGAKFATYLDLRSHCYSAHPAPEEGMGMAIRNMVGTTSCDLCSGTTMGCYFHFWLEDGIARKLVKSGYVAAHVDFCYRATRLVKGTQYRFAAFGVSGNRVVCRDYHFIPDEPWWTGWS